LTTVKSVNKTDSMILIDTFKVTDINIVDQTQLRIADCSWLLRTIKFRVVDCPFKFVFRLIYKVLKKALYTYI